MRVIFDDGNAMPARDSHDRVHFASNARVMHKKNRFRARGNALLDLAFIDVQRVRANIHEDRLGARKHERICRRGKREGGNNDFVSRSDIQEQRSHFQRMSAGRRQERFLNPKRMFEEAMALRSEVAVAGKFRRRDGGANVIKFISRRERTIERNADHDGLKGFRPTNKSDPPAGNETPVLITIRSNFKMLSRVLLSAGPISNSRHGWKS